MITKPKPILISAESETELEQKKAALQALADVATIASLQILQEAIEKGVDVNAKLKKARNLGAI